MTRLALIATLLTAGCLGEAGPSGAAPDDPGGGPADMPIRSDPLPPPAPKGAPEAAEAAAALAAGNSAALILFLARHPADPAAPRVRAALAGRREPVTPADAMAVAGGEAAVIGAFDAARLSGTPAAWADFTAHYGSHPLAAEAARWQGR
ncbi:hypothetical protein GIY56_12310 [Paracoccus sp. YIM 132242]|uniref:DUF3035 domain-containing protein n=1 Tax=Paracoccus lichenicola TaxID=2665644 RepID=A0A6L6HRL7_9RHOB|nr:hypothetical protein [Paracoccus lichenicola]MTE01079.1 hypothetical protein [Paracoccus lichenicola]